jgi:hypothetical protein
VYETHSAKGQQQPRPQPVPSTGPASDPETQNEAWDNEGGHAPSAPGSSGKGRSPHGTAAPGDRSSRDAGTL